MKSLDRASMKQRNQGSQQGTTRSSSKDTHKDDESRRQLNDQLSVLRNEFLDIRKKHDLLQKLKSKQDDSLLRARRQKAHMVEQFERQKLKLRQEILQVQQDIKASTTRTTIQQKQLDRLSAAYGACTHTPILATVPGVSTPHSTSIADSTVTSSDHPELVDRIDSTADELVKRLLSLEAERNRLAEVVDLKEQQIRNLNSDINSKRGSLPSHTPLQHQHKRTTSLPVSASHASTNVRTARSAVSTVSTSGHTIAVSSSVLLSRKPVSSSSSSSSSSTKQAVISPSSESSSSRIKSKSTPSTSETSFASNLICQEVTPSCCYAEPLTVETHLFSHTVNAVSNTVTSALSEVLPTELASDSHFRSDTVANQSSDTVVDSDLNLDRSEVDKNLISHKESLIPSVPPVSTIETSKEPLSSLILTGFPFPEDLTDCVELLMVADYLDVPELVDDLCRHMQQPLRCTGDQNGSAYTTLDDHIKSQIFDSMSADQRVSKLLAEPDLDPSVWRTRWVPLYKRFLNDDRIEKQQRESSDQYGLDDLLIDDEGRWPTPLLAVASEDPENPAVAENVSEMTHSLLAALFSTTAQPLRDVTTYLPPLAVLRCVGVSQSLEPLVVKLSAATMANTLVTLQLRGCNPLSELAVINCIKNMPNLEHVDLCGIKNCGDPVLEAIGMYLRKLITLQLSSCVAISDQGMESFCQAILSTSESSQPGISSDGPTLKNLCRTLQCLNLSNCTNLTDRTLKALGSCLVHLEDLCIFGCYRMTDNGIYDLLQCSRREHSLKRFNCCGCYKITEDGRRFLILSIPTLLLYNKPKEFALLWKKSNSRAAQLV